MWNEPSKSQLDNLPALYATEDIPLKEKTIYLHFFFGGCDWYIAEYDGNDLFWGFVILNNDHQNAEWGYISFREIKSLNVLGSEVDNDQYWKPCQACSIEKIKNCASSSHW